MQSLSKALGKDADPSLFHQSLGMLNPLTGILELGPASLSIEKPETTEDYEQISRRLAALLHERHHWLQLVGSSSGMFLTFMLELQSSFVGSIVQLDRVEADDLPLLDSLSPDDALVQMWCRAESARRIFYGARTGDISLLFDRGFRPHWSQLSGQLSQIFDASFEGTEAEATAKKLWELGPGESGTKTGSLSLLRHSGWVGGARHLMECGARVNEALKLASDLTQLRRGQSVQVGDMFTGVYGLANDIFYEVHGEPSIGKEIALAYLCDRALNVPLPPIMPIRPELIGSIFPMYVFIMCVNALKGYEFSDEIDLRDTDSIDAYAASLSEWLLRSPLESMLLATDGLKSRLLENVSPTVQPDDLYTTTGGQFPTPKRPGSRNRYFWACCSQAQKVRSEHPGFFALPISWYLKDRSDFHRIFDHLMPPLVRYGEQGIAPTSHHFGWLEFFLGASVQHEILRGMMFLDVNPLSQRLAPFRNSIGGHEHGNIVLQAAIRGTFGKSALSDLIMNRTL